MCKFRIVIGDEIKVKSDCITIDKTFKLKRNVTCEKKTYCPINKEYIDMTYFPFDEYDISSVKSLDDVFIEIITYCGEKFYFPVIKIDELKNQTPKIF